VPASVKNQGGVPALAPEYGAGRGPAVVGGTGHIFEYGVAEVVVLA